MSEQTIRTGRSHVNRILVVDDMVSTHDDFRAILQDSGAEARDSADEVGSMATDILGRGGAAPTTTRKARPTYDLAFASQGEEGFGAVRQAIEEDAPFALAFVDMRMPPGWNGLETIQHIREVDPELEIVICTAYSDHDWEEIFDKLGPADNVLLLKKPFDPDEVKQMASALTRRWQRQQMLLEQIGGLKQLQAEETSARLDQIADDLRHGEERWGESTGNLNGNDARNANPARRYRNRAERYRCATHVQVELDDDGRGEFTRSLALTTIDISTSGIAFRSRTYIEPGGIVRFSVPGVKRKSFIIGKGIDCDRDTSTSYRIGVKFLDVVDRPDDANTPVA